MSNSTYLSLLRQTMLTSSLRAKLQPISLYWAALVEKALKWVRYSRLPYCFLQCCSAQHSEIADQAVWEACWTLKIPVFSGPGPFGGAFSAPPDPLAHQTGYHTNLPRLSKSPPLLLSSLPCHLALSFTLFCHLRMLFCDVISQIIKTEISQKRDVLEKK